MINFLKAINFSFSRGVSWLRISGVAVAMVFGLSGCATPNKPALSKGNVHADKRPMLPPFHGVVVNGGYNVVITAGADDDCAHLSGNSALVNGTRIYVRRGILYVNPPRGSVAPISWGRLGVHVRHLTRLGHRGHGHMSVQGVNTETLTVQVDGGTMTVAGQAQQVRARVSGRGRLQLQELKVHNALSMFVVGHGRVYYTHDIKHVNQQTRGNGQVLPQ